MSVSKFSRPDGRQVWAEGFQPDWRPSVEEPLQRNETTDHAQPPLTGPLNSEPELIPDRRSFERYRTTYRPCCVLATETVTMGLIRNISRGGALVEIDAEFKAGETIRYFWEANACIAARIAWRDGNAYGLEHLDSVREISKRFPFRSVRVPCAAEARCWINGEVHTASVENISLGGMRLTGLPKMRPGALLSVSFCGLDFESASVRWSDQRHAGIRFASRITRETLANLLLDDRFGLSVIDFGPVSARDSQLKFEG